LWWRLIVALGWGLITAQFSVCCLLFTQRLVLTTADFVVVDIAAVDVEVGIADSGSAEDIVVVGHLVVVSIMNICHQTHRGVPVVTY